MTLERNNALFFDAKQRQKERLDEVVTWFPFPAFISFGLVLTLGVFLVPDLNPRLGSPADVMHYPAAEEPEGSLWLGVKLIGDEVVVVTSEREVYRWPAQLKSQEPLNRFTVFLKKKADAEISIATLSRETSAQRLSVIIAADQRLKYLHIRPILNALADARITNYAFETILVAKQ